MGSKKRKAKKFLQYYGEEYKPSLMFNRSFRFVLLRHGVMVRNSMGRESFIEDKPQMVKQISVDLDHSSIVQLLRVYFSARRMLPGVPMEITVSSSGVGFHIKLFKQVPVEEDLKIRALLWDHADRLVYALKKWALQPNEAYVDLIFDEKNQGKEKVLPLEQILNGYEKEVENITALLDKGENEKADEKVRKLAKAIEPQVSLHKGKSYVGMISFNGEQLREDLEKVCGDIAAKDATFTWKVYPCWTPKWDWYLALFGTDNDKLWQRLVWLKNNAYVEKEGVKTLILKNADTRMWVKERKST
jgi:hypothetical protein